MRNLFIILFAFISIYSGAQKSSFFVLGDIHYDLIEDHDMEWVKTEKPNDVRQIEEYTTITKNNWNDFMSVLENKINKQKFPPRAIIQLGDLSEGLAGNPQKAKQMAASAVSAIQNTEMPVPWIIAKGNHDITGPGAEDAFQEFYVPMFRRQTDNPNINNANYSYKYDNVQITCIDPWDKETDMAAFLENELSKSNARFKFVVIHEPIIPVTERCWHTMRRDQDKREKLLEVIAKNNAIVLCGHLHRYSVVRRNTSYGPIVQVMVISVIKDRNYTKPSKVITEYGPSLAENVPDWQPETLEKRKAILSEEEKYVTFYKQTDLPGYAIIKIDEKKESVNLEYYAAFDNKPYDKIDLTELQEK